MAGTFNVKRETIEKPEGSAVNPRIPRYSPEFIRLMSELEEVTSGYTSMLQKAQKAHTSLSRMESARETLECYEKKLVELFTPVHDLADRSERLAANTRLTCVYNAVSSSLNSLMRFS